jgi:hypothetical protein
MDFIFKAQDFLIDFNKNQPVGKETDTVKVNVQNIELGGNKYKFMPLGILNDPFSLLNAPNKKFSGLGIVVPSGRTSDVNGKSSPMFSMRYLAQFNAISGKSWYAMQHLGYYGQPPTNTQAVRETHFKYSIGAETHRSREVILLTPSV